MPRQRQSQWDFGELFSQSDLRRVLTVAELTGQIRRLLESQVGAVWVSGEVSNLRVQASGHCYFTLKDATAQLACVLFRGEARATRHLLEDGRGVILQGDLTVYEPRGQYQLRVTAVEVRGLGALQVAFEQLKTRLQAEGLFDPDRKRPLPLYPARLGIVTSPTGAALRDVLHVLRRRFPALDLILAPARVQGEGAAAEIAAAIARLNAWSAAAPPSERIDLILVTRGGGSLEDLWAFNEEIVARAIHGSALPVVSAIGHETDFTISDFVADVRAATPSAAAEILTEHLWAGRLFVSDLVRRLPAIMAACLASRRETFESLRARLERLHPVRRIQLQSQRLDELNSNLQRTVRSHWRALLARSRSAFVAWTRLRPEARLTREKQVLAQLEQRLHQRVLECGKDHRARLDRLAERLRLLSPGHTLARGYSITRDADTGRLIRSVEEARHGQRIETHVRDGRFHSVVEPPSAASHPRPA